jgi:hypothetical protein
MQSSNFDNTPGSEDGWRIDSTGLAELQNVIVRGTVYATNGTLSNLTVLDSLTVGDNATGTTNTIQSYDYNASTDGWIIRGDGYAEFNEVTVRGAIYATSGELGNLNVINDITVTSGAIKSGNYAAGVSGWQISSDGTAEFQDTLVRGEILATSGGIAGTFGVSGDLYVHGVDGTIRSQAPSDGSGNKVMITQDDYLQIYGLNSTGWDDTFWKVYTTDQDNFLVEQGGGFGSPSTADSLGLATRTDESNTTRFQAYHGSAFSDADKQTVFIRVGNESASANKDWSIGSGAGIGGASNEGYMSFVESEQAFYFNDSPNGMGELLSIYAKFISGTTIYLTSSGGTGGTIEVETTPLASPTGLTGFAQEMQYNSDGTPSVDYTIVFSEVSGADGYETRIRRL